MVDKIIVRVAIDCPLSNTFDYIVPSNLLSPSSTDELSDSLLNGAQSKFLTKKSSDSDSHISSDEEHDLVADLENKSIQLLYGGSSGEFNKLPSEICFEQNLKYRVKLGVRVFVPFGRRKKVLGIVVANTNESNLSYDKLREITSIIDREPVLTEPVLNLGVWLSKYYHYPLGETLFSLLPSFLRSVNSIVEDLAPEYVFNTNFSKKIKLSLVQQNLWDIINNCKNKKSSSYELLAAGCNRRTIISAVSKGWLLPIFNSENISSISQIDSLQNFSLHEIIIKDKTIGVYYKDHNSIEKIDNYSTMGLEFELMKKINLKKIDSSSIVEVTKAEELNKDQQIAVDRILSSLGSFKVWLLYGITGSGKTEVYMQSIVALLRLNKQVMILVPEISLTPQTVLRFKQRFPNLEIGVLHSQLSEKEKFQVWKGAYHKQISLVIGTRSAIFLPLPDLGMIIVDEEHDQSFKQQSGLRYSARDLATIRGQISGIPVLLGSATPSLESIYNVKIRRYEQLTLSGRAGNAQLPKLEVVDLRGKKLHSGLSDHTLQIMQKHLSQGKQVLVFLNRRGFSPSWLCHNCGWSANCINCDSKMVLHLYPYEQLICHHCQFCSAVNNVCPKCLKPACVAGGVGTEKLEQYLVEHFSIYRHARIDRDSAKNFDNLTLALERISSGEVQLIIGTQMLAKGHHFPALSLVVVVDTDNSLYSGDFRATEKLAQLLLQVSGRAGRSSQDPGEVLIQTHLPEHPIFSLLTKDNTYSEFAEICLDERKKACLPPYSYLVFIRAQSESMKYTCQILYGFINLLKNIVIKSNLQNSIDILGPIPSLMERKLGYYRAQILLKSPQRSSLHQVLSLLLPKIRKQKLHSNASWYVDIDPIDVL